MKLPYEEFDLSGVKTYPLRSRASKVSLAQFATPYKKGAGIPGLIRSLPALLAAQDFKDVVAAIVAAKQNGKAIVWGLGAHVLKTGLSPILVDLMERGFISAIATNGAGIIHDFEIALSGGTSEDVDATLGPGTFGMAEETGTAIESARSTTVWLRDWAWVRQSASICDAAKPSFAQISVAATAWRLQIPVTVHVAVGTDIIHMHPQASGAAIGEGEPA